MALLLKVQRAALTGPEAVVPRMKSADLVAADRGDTVYVWLADPRGETGALHSVATLSAFAEIMVPQDRDPAKTKHAYRLTLDLSGAEIAQPLTARDLGPTHHVEGADGIESLGRIHRDRNDKIMRLTGAEATVLAERFRH